MSSEIYEPIAAPSDEDVKKVAKWLNGGFVLEFVKNPTIKKLPIPDDVKKIFKKNPELVLNDDEWNSLCDTMAKKSWLPGAKERCKGTANFGNWGETIRQRIQIHPDLQIANKRPSDTEAIADRMGGKRQ